MSFKSDVENYVYITKGSTSVSFFAVFIYFFHPRLMPIGIYRVSSFFYRKRIKLLAQFFSFINQIFFGLEISPRVKIGRGFFMPHSRATVIGAKEIGNYVTVYQNVTIGAKYLDFDYNSETRPVIGNHVIIGTGATVLGGIKVGNNVRIGPHTLVTTEIKDNTKYVLNAYSSETPKTNIVIKAKPEILNFRQLGDQRGLLIAIEEIKDIPFEIKRVYYIFDTKQQVRRGFHAHKNLNQIAIAVKGSCKFLVDDGNTKLHFTLDEPSKGLLLNGFLWREMYDFSDDCVLLVIADQYYDESDYIRSYDDFMKIVNLSKGH